MDEWKKSDEKPERVTLEKVKEWVETQDEETQRYVNFCLEQIDPAEPKPDGDIDGEEEGELDSRDDPEPKPEVDVGELLKRHDAIKQRMEV